MCSGFINNNKLLSIIYNFRYADIMGEKYIQQDDNYREFMNNITDGGLQYAYHTWIQGESAKEFYRQKVADDKKRHIIIVGAGMSGLAAAYELAQVGHKVEYFPIFIFYKYIYSLSF